MLKVSFDLESPYKPRDKCIWPAVIAAAGALGSSILGGVLGNSSQSSANKTNLDVANATNRSNEYINERQLTEAWNMARYQNDWNLQQWQRENEYNSPAQQMLRYRMAGVNPYFTDMTNGNAQNLQAASMSPPAQNPMQAAQVQPLDYSWVGNAVSSGVNAFYQNQLMQAQIEKGSADAKIAWENAKVQGLRNAHEILKIANDASRSESERDMARSLLKVQQASEANQIYHADLMNKISEKEVYSLQEKIAGQQIQNKLASIDSQYRARMNAAQLRQYDANIVQAYAAARAGDASAAASYAAAAVSDVTAAGIKIDNKTKGELNRAILDKAWSEAESANDSRLFQILDKNFEYQGKVGQYFPMQSGQFSAADRYSNWYRQNRSRGFKKR